MINFQEFIESKNYDVRNHYKVFKDQQGEYIFRNFPQADERLEKRFNNLIEDTEILKSFLADIEGKYVKIIHLLPNNFKHEITKNIMLNQRMIQQFGAERLGPTSI